MSPQQKYGEKAALRKRARELVADWPAIPVDAVDRLTVLFRPIAKKAIK